MKFLQERDLRDDMTKIKHISVLCKE